jgi:hypothetical protein
MAKYKNDTKYKNNAEFTTSAAIKHLFWNDANGSALQVNDVVDLGILPPDTITTDMMIAVDTAFIGTAPAIDINVVNADGSLVVTITGINVSKQGIIILGNIGTTAYNPDGTTFIGDKPVIWNKDDGVNYSVIWKGGSAPTAGALRIIFSYNHLEQTDDGFGLATQPFNIYTGV